MTKDDIIGVAHDADFYASCDWDRAKNPSHWQQCRDEHFANLVAAHEREACARIAGIALLGADKALADRVVNAIRARGQS